MFIIEKLIDTVAPHLCLICEEEGSVLCKTCRLDATSVLPSRCFMCNAVTKNYATCPKCRRKTAIKNVWVAGEYAGCMKKLIADYKFSRQRAAAKVLAGFMTDILPSFEQKPTVTFVPTATDHIRRRGYDHAELLARELGKQTGYKAPRLLVKINRTHQIGANRTRRLEQLKGSFRAIRCSFIEGADILLIDDVLTTGATLQTAAATLKAAGANKIYAAVAAKHI